MLKKIFKFSQTHLSTSSLRSFSSGQRTPIRDEILAKKNDYCNVPDKILDLVDRRLYTEADHPIGIIWSRLKEFFNDPNSYRGPLQSKFKVPFTCLEGFSPIVTTKSCFDDMLVPLDHVSRKKSETYYIKEDLLLRSHTTAHEQYLLNSGEQAWVLIGDVYRRDTIDATHYPCFHQMEAVRVFDPKELGFEQEDQMYAAVVEDLQSTMESLAKHLFGDVQTRWIPAYFPFTNPSLELEIYFMDQWVEMLGCGIMHPDIMEKCGRGDKIAWAAGLGLERFAMKLFDIPDIRLFWSQDERFLGQFKKGEITQFKPFSKYPSCFKDISFWVEDITKFEENDVFEAARGVAGDLIERIDCVDTFTDKKRNRTSKCYRIFYRSLERTLLNDEIDVLQFKLRDEIKNSIGVELR